MAGKESPKHQWMPNTLIVIAAFGLLSALPGEVCAKPWPDDPLSAAEKAAAKNGESAIAHKSLRRLDFRVVGKSCAVCLLGIQRRVKTVNGVVKMAVMLKPPYGAVVLYDSQKTAPNKLLDMAKKGEGDVKLEGIQDASIDRIPLVLLPIHNRLKDGKGAVTNLPVNTSSQGYRPR